MKFLHSLFLYLTFSLINYSAFVGCAEKDAVQKLVNKEVSSNSDPTKTEETAAVPVPKTTVDPPKKFQCPKGCKCSPDRDTAGTLDGYTVTCSGSALTIQPDSYDSSDKTTHLDLSDNQLKRIDAFDHYDHLIRLNLSRNQIAVIEPQAFKELQNLQFLDLSFNGLSSIENMVFAKLQNLKTIDLSENEISKIDANVFDDQQWLEVLNLRGNSLKRLPESLFTSTLRLRILDLSHNAIYSLPDSIFHFTPALTTIDLSENQFTVVPNEDLTGATKLEELDMSANMMKKLDHASFSGLTSLKIIKINNCPQLTEIDDFTLSYLNSLEHLEIKNNPRLTTLSPSAFFGFAFNPTNLKEVDLNGNQLSRLTEHTLPFCNLSIVDLRDNQWRCDCHFKWVKSCRQSDPIHQQIRCTSPLQLASLEIGAIDSDQFTCPVDGNGFTREIRLFRLFVVLFGVLTLVFMGFMVIYYLHKAKVIRSFGHKYQRMGSIHYVKDQTTEVIQE